MHLHSIQISTKHERDAVDNNERNQIYFITPTTYLDSLGIQGRISFIKMDVFGADIPRFCSSPIARQTLRCLITWIPNYEGEWFFQYVFGGTERV